MAATESNATDVVDLTDDEFVSDPFTAYSRIRENGPLTLGVIRGVSPFWLVTRYEDVKQVLGDSRFVVNPANVPGMETQDRMEGIQLGGGFERKYLEYLRAAMSVMDGVDHLRLRRILSRSFTPRRIALLRPRVEKITEELLDRLPHVAEDGGVDLLEHFAQHLPLTVICELLDIPEQDRSEWRGWRLGEAPRGRADRHSRGVAAADYICGLVERRRTELGDDLVSALIRAQDEDGDRLSELELVAMVLNLIVAGHETTVHLISNGIAALLAHPDQLRLLRERPELMPGAVNELLRWCGPAVLSSTRYATEDVEIGGEPVRKGDAVMPVLAAANFDPRVFDEPERLDITREPLRGGEPHVGFGHGPHFCMGAALARQEAAVAFEALFTRFPGIELAVDPAELEHGRGGVWRLASLPVRI